jgi:hypothetical protein
MRLAALALLAALTPAAAIAQPPPCGFSPTDWCSSPANDPCGRHKTAEACRADNACHGLRYRGTSTIACLWDARGFASNCPTVGCVSAPKK